MRLLIAEDDIKIARSLKRGLQEEGFAVDVVHDGDAAIIEASNEPYDAIVLDWMMPEKDGPTVIRELRDQSITTPIIMLTARDSTKDRVSGLNTGADDYLIKPFSFEELLARIRALLRRPSQSLNQELKYGDITLEPDKFAVHRAGQLVELSRREFSLLEVFMRNPEILLSKDQIISKVWPFDADVLPNTVEVHIKSLRQKLDKPFGKDSIKTVRGFGYKLEIDNV
ncbi:response regulator transcription factor [Candidatus Saccharibacteria bacterium]|nr:response regulator transcription factor [Candidatus Saccharibacteria bacterium]MCB9821039.1 response regulator transcription factor [Candidatus Nomurabacteria bacterium]